MTEKARIYRPARTAMQQGRAKSNEWVLEYAPSEARRADSLMGWIGSGDTRRQLQLRFPTKEAAVDYAEEHGIDLDTSWAYGASAADALLLSAIGQPCAVNPDRQLRRIARDHQWAVIDGPGADA